MEVWGFSNSSHLREPDIAVSDGQSTHLWSKRRRPQCIRVQFAEPKFTLLCIILAVKSGESVHVHLDSQKRVDAIARNPYKADAPDAIDFTIGMPMGRVPLGRRDARPDLRRVALREEAMSAPLLPPPPRQLWWASSTRKMNGGRARLADVPDPPGALGIAAVTELDEYGTTDSTDADEI